MSPRTFYPRGGHFTLQHLIVSCPLQPNLLRTYLRLSASYDDGSVVRIPSIPGILVTGRAGFGKMAASCDDGSVVRILVTGRAGVGKSALVNGIVAHDVATLYHSIAYSPESERLKIYHHNWNGVYFYIGETSDSSIGKIGKHVPDLVIYCVSMTDRITPQTFEGFFGVFGADNVVIVLTFANRVRNREPDSDAVKQTQSFGTKLIKWNEAVHESLESAGVPKISAKQIPVVPAGNYTDTELSLPDRKDWRAALWETCLKRVRTEVRPVLCRLHQQTENRIDNKPTLRELQLIKWNKGSITKQLKLTQLIAPHWKALGSCLGIHPMKLELFEMQNMLHPEECCWDVLQSWLEENSKPTWRGLCEALENSGSIDIGKKLREALTEVSIYSDQCTISDPVLGVHTGVSKRRVPHLADLVNNVRTVRWFELGIYLGLNLSVLRMIEADSPRDSRRALFTMLRKWLQKSANPTWEDLVDAMKMIGEEENAIEIQRIFC